MKPSILVLFALALVLGAILAEGPRPPATASAAADQRDAQRDSSERAITILLPELAARLDAAAAAGDSQDIGGVLSVARGYQELGLAEAATAWYERLENLNGASFFADAIFHGRFELALQGASSSEALSLLIDSYAEQIADPDATLLTRAFTGVGRRGDWAAAGRLVERSLALYAGPVPADLLYLQGRVLRRENRLAEALMHFEQQLAALAAPETVHPTLIAQRPRFLRAAADCAFLMNDQLRARGLYSQLVFDDEADPEQRQWARFQLAQMDMLANAYAEAEISFRGIVADSLGTPAGQFFVFIAEHCAAMKTKTASHPALNASLSATLD
ncbi:hypothetical protein FJ251_12135 [bacterium]|nr:hypothetical protein [bacterium]